MMGYVIAFLLGWLAHVWWTRATSGDAPLHIACRHGNEKAVQLLLKSGADPNVYNVRGQTPLSLACGADCAAIVKMLLDKHADPLGGTSGLPPSRALKRLGHAVPYGDDGQ